MKETKFLKNGKVVVSSKLGLGEKKRGEELGEIGWGRRRKGGRTGGRRGRRKEKRKEKKGKKKKGKEKKRKREGKERKPKSNTTKVHNNIQVSKKNGLSPLSGHPMSLDI